MYTPSTKNFTSRVSLFIWLAIFIVALFTGCSAEVATNDYQNINSEKLLSILQNEDSFILMDVREPGELLETGIIPGAINKPVKKVKKEFSTLPRKGKLIIYCRTGNRSAYIAKFLADKGFENIYNLKDGIVGWPYKKAGWK